MPLWGEVMLYILATGFTLACTIVAACGIVSSRVSRSEESGPYQITAREWMRNRSERRDQARSA
jgi:hypothetical protein